MTQCVLDPDRNVLARQLDEDPALWRCAHDRCPVLLQRTVDGSIVDGVRQHYTTVHGRTYAADTQKENP